MNLNEATVVVSVALAHFFALLSPGADFVLIVRSGMTKPFRRAIGVAIGISAANGVYIALCLAGLGPFIAGSPASLRILKIAGGVYLCWLGATGLRSKRSADRVFSGMPAQGDSTAPEGTAHRETVAGFLSSLLNPKLPLFYFGLFSLALGKGLSMTIRLALGAWMAAIVFLWDACILFALTRPRVRTSFLRRVRLIDRATGLVLLVVGVMVLFSAR
jgi:threonine/homoserine/homoserine lactone efflux protein